MEYTLPQLLRKVFTDTITAEEEQYYKDHFMGEEEKQLGKPFFRMNKEEEVKMQVLEWNNKIGNKTGYNCSKCKNRGDIAVYRNGVFNLVNCDCLDIRETIKLMEESGLGNLLKEKSFDKYECKEDWQKYIYNKAKAFINDDKNWFFIGGNNGSGKSHICTAMVKEFLKQGLPTKYMLWVDESIELKQAITNGEDYQEAIQRLKNVQVLYIDDFLWADKDHPITSADIRLAMEILNYRYNKARTDKSKRWITIISSERSTGEIIDINEAVGSRITEMTKPDYYLYIAKDRNKNYRLK